MSQISRDTDFVLQLEMIVISCCNSWITWELHKRVLFSRTYDSETLSIRLMCGNHLAVFIDETWSI